MRIGPDVAPAWAPDERNAIPGLESTAPATRNAVRNILSRTWMHRRLWLNDPDCLMARTRETDLTPAERAAEVSARLYAILEAYDDSMAAELARELERLDWTIGEEGEEWGISPGKIHLGGITLPLPLYFGLDPAKARRREGSIAEWNAIQNQAARGLIDELFDERIRAIREQRAREEAERAARKDTTGGN